MSRQRNQIDDARVADLAAQGLSNVAIARELGCDESSVRRARKRINAATAGSTPTEVGGESETHDSNGSNYVRFSDRPWGYDDFREFIRANGLDPDKVTFTHGWTSKPGGGFWNKLNNVRPIVEPAQGEVVDLPALYAAANTSPQPAVGERSDRTTIVVWSDPQIGKVASRGGTTELIARSAEKRAKLAALLTERAPSQCVLLDGGDGIEGFESGGNPMFTNDLSLARQLDLYGTELLEWVKVMLPYGQVDVLGVPSNHTAWRNGKQNLGNPGDDLGLFMHRQVAKISAAASLNTVFHAPAEYDESAAIDVNGTRIGLVHGNQFGPGQAVTWWEKQTFGAQAVATADILVTAHYHSFGAGVAGRNPASGKQRWWLGAPTLDNGSDWYRNTAGRDSDPGVLVFDITPDGFDLGSLTIL